MVPFFDRSCVNRHELLPTSLRKRDASPRAIRPVLSFHSQSSLVYMNSLITVIARHSEICVCLIICLPVESKACRFFKFHQVSCTFILTGLIMIHSQGPSCNICSSVTRPSYLTYRLSATQILSLITSQLI